MALIQCPECGATISDEAESCPYCGRKSDAVMKEETKEGCASSMMSIGVAMTVFITIPVLLFLFCGL